MRVSLKIVIIALLLFNSLTALYGGWELMAGPDGSSIGLSTDLLKHSPFPDYFIPGLVLFVANGVFSVNALLSLLFSRKNCWLHVVTQGAILFGWIVVQILMIRTVHFQHIILGTIGMVLIIAGYLLKRISWQTHSPTI